MDVECISTNHITSNDIAEQVRLVTQGYFGAMGDEQVNACRLLGRFEQYIPPIDGSDVGRHVVALSLEITHNQTIPTY
jgi:ribulose bisphosphate carboxylase small subunit